jgi:hypothetical protein
VLAVFSDFKLRAKKKRKSTEKKVFICSLDFLQTHQLIQGRIILKFECAGKIHCRLLELIKQKSYFKFATLAFENSTRI